MKSRQLKGRPAEMPRVWWTGNPVMTHLFNALSVLLPVGETFFIRTVKLFEQDIDDVDLRRDVKTFVAQEAEHSREHAQWYNRELARQGYDVSRIGRIFSWLMGIGPKRLRPIQLLALSVASEHVTAVLSYVFLKHPQWLEGASEEYRRIWVWHAVEEIEHKAVVFDIYRTVGGGYFMRCAALLQTLFVFHAVILQMMLSFLYHDGLLSKPRTWLQLLGLLALGLRNARTLVGAYLAYFVPGFHPDQHDDEGVLAFHEQRLSSSCI